MLIVKFVKGKLAAAAASAATSGATSGGTQAPIPRANNSVAPSSSYEPRLEGVQVPDAPQMYGYQGLDALDLPAQYNPPTHLPPLSNAPTLPAPQLGYNPAAGQAPLSSIPNASYESELISPAVYNLWV